MSTPEKPPEEKSYRIDSDMLQNLRTTLREHFHTINQKVDFEREAGSLGFHPDEHDRRNNLVTEQLIQVDYGIFAVQVASTELPVTDIIPTFIHWDPKRPNGETATDLFETIGAEHGVPKNAAEAAAWYYLRHKKEFDAYYIVQDALNKNDRLLTPKADTVVNTDEAQETVEEQLVGLREALREEFLPKMNPPADI